MSVYMVCIGVCICFFALSVRNICERIRDERAMLHPYGERALFSPQGLFFTASEVFVAFVSVTIIIFMISLIVAF